MLRLYEVEQSPQLMLYPKNLNRDKTVLLESAEN